MDPRLSFLLYLADPREFDVLRPIVESTFGGKLEHEDDDVPFEQRAHRFELESFGLRVAVSHHRGRGLVYLRIAGGTARRFYHASMKSFAIDAHVTRLLRAAGFTQVMAHSDYARWDREPVTQPRPTVRTPDEIDAHLAANPCDACGAVEFERHRTDEQLGDVHVTSYAGPCSRCGAYRYFEVIEVAGTD